MKATYSASGKRSQPFTFSTFCYVPALFQNGFILFSPQNSLHITPVFVFENLASLYRKKPTEKSHFHRYSQPLRQHLWQKPQVFLNLMPRAQRTSLGAFVHLLCSTFSDPSGDVGPGSSLALAGPLKEPPSGALWENATQATVCTGFPLATLIDGLLQTWLSFWEVLLSLENSRAVEALIEQPSLGHPYWQDSFFCLTVSGLSPPSSPPFLCICAVLRVGGGWFKQTHLLLVYKWLGCLNLPVTLLLSRLPNHQRVNRAAVFPTGVPWVPDDRGVE